MSKRRKTCWVIFQCPEGIELFEGVYSDAFPSTFEDLANIEIQGHTYYVPRREIFKTKAEALFVMNLRGTPIKKINENLVEFFDSRAGYKRFGPADVRT